MRLGLVAFSLASTCLCSSISFAGESGIKSFAPAYRPVITAFGGYASINAGSSGTFIGTDDNVFIYRASSDGNNDGFGGGFLGIEHALPWYNLFGQLGVEYSYFGAVNVNGVHTVGIEPGTSTLYTYGYNYQTQQVLASAKLLATAYQIYHPYVSAGIGAAFNKMSHYRALAAEVGSLNLTPGFSGHTESDFSYSVGAGIDVDVNQNFRVGLGYRFSGFGDASLTHGAIMINNYAYPVPFTLRANDAYANQLIAHISYVM